jgi:hypothetical protein
VGQVSFACQQVHDSGIEAGSSGSQMKFVVDEGLSASGVERPLAKHLSIVPDGPLWQRVPTRDESGKLLADFMVLIPRLKARPAQYIQASSSYIKAVLIRHEEVVFADVNLKLNLLWVSHRYRPGLMLEIVSALRVRLPEAVLVAHQCSPP